MKTKTSIKQITSDMPNIERTIALALVLLILSTTANRANGIPDDLAQQMAASNHFFSTVDAIQSGQPLRSWRNERSRLMKIQEKIASDSPSLVSVKLLRRLGVCEVFLSAGKGSKKADMYYAQAELQLSRLASPAKKMEILATLHKERADNLVFMGEDQKAEELLTQSLREGLESTYKGALGEAIIREDLAGIYFRLGKWQKALTVVNPAVEITSTQRTNKEALRMSLWYKAVATSRLRQDAEPLFNRYLNSFSTTLTNHDKANALREAAGNVVARKPASESQRLESLKRANGYLLRAKEIIIQSHSEQDEEEKVSILSDLAVSDAILGLAKNSETNFREAIAAAENSPSLGRNWPGLIRIRERFVTLLKKLGQTKEWKRQLQECRRIERDLQF